MRVGVSTEVIEQALIVVGHDAPYNSLADEIRSYRWDGAPRLHRWLSEYMLANDIEYHREVGRRYLVQAVARAMQPGCKADQVLVLEGKTGARKSSAIEAIAGRRHYSASRIDIKSNFVGGQLLGVWFYELPEMSFIRANDVREVTGFITLPFDDYAPKNVKRKVTQMRTCVFAGTTEDERYLRSNTNRRFWPVKVGQKIRLDEIARDREQLIGEALWLYDNDYQWYLDDDGEALAREQQDMRRQSHSWEEPISSWMAKNEGAIEERGYVTVAQILRHALNKKPDAWNLADEQRVADILAVFGWRRGGSRPEEPYRRRIKGVGRVYPYYPPDDPVEPQPRPSVPVVLCTTYEPSWCEVTPRQSRTSAPVVLCTTYEPSWFDVAPGQPGQELGQQIPTIESLRYTCCPSCPSLFSSLERERERAAQPGGDTPSPP
jgi:putative DNA primase/helicase